MSGITEILIILILLGALLLFLLQQNSDVSIIHHNINGIRTKGKRLYQKLKDYIPDFLCISEHKIKGRNYNENLITEENNTENETAKSTNDTQKENDNKKINDIGHNLEKHCPPEYNVASSFQRKDCKNASGGTVIFVNDKKQQNYIPRHDLENLSVEWNVEISAIEFIFPNIVLCCIYRVQKYKNRPDSGNIELFYNKMKEILDVIKVEEKSVIMMGDFNIDVLKEDAKKNKYLKFLEENQVKLMNIYEPSRVTMTTRTLIDHILIANYSENDFISDYECEQLLWDEGDEKISDHRAQLLKIKPDIARFIKELIKAIVPIILSSQSTAKLDSECFKEELKKAVVCTN